jgi:hypothetical protein
VTEGFDLKDWAIRPEDLPKCDGGGAKPAPKPGPARYRRDYVPAIPLWWTERLPVNCPGASIHILWLVVRQYRINGGKPVAVPKSALRISGPTKSRCLAKLVKLGILKRDGNTKPAAYVPVFDPPQS